MAGMVLDALLMLLLVAALGYGVRLERKLRTLRDGQIAFAGAVTELNQAAGRAEAALASLRAAGQETDLLHDRILKARELKAQLEGLMARAASPPAATTQEAARDLRLLDDEHARRIASLAARLEADSSSSPDGRRGAQRSGGSGPLGPAHPVGSADFPPLTGRETHGRGSLVLQALAANQAAQQSLNRARASLDADLFAA